MMGRSLAPNDGPALGVMMEKLTFDIAQHKRRIEDGRKQESSQRGARRRGDQSCTQRLFHHARRRCAREG
jgi:hypothetical protein